MGDDWHIIHIYAGRVDTLPQYRSDFVVPRSTETAEQTKAVLPAWRPLIKVVGSMALRTTRPYAQAVWDAAMNAMGWDRAFPQEIISGSPEMDRHPSTQVSTICC